MSETPTLNKPRLMREEIHPALSPALETAAPSWIAGNTSGTITGPLRDIRTAAFAALRKLGLPHAGSEDFSFIRVGEFLPHLGPPAGISGAEGSSTAAGIRPSLADIRASVFPECRESYLAFIDGIYAPELSNPDPGFRVKALAEASRETIAAVLSAISDENDAAASLAMLFAQGPALIEIAPGATPIAPLQILHYRTDAASPVSTAADSKPGNRKDTFVVIHAGRLSESRILASHTAASAAETDAMMNIHALAILDEAASLKFLESGLADAPADSAADNRTLHFRKLTARIARNGRLQALSAHAGSRLTRNSFAIDLLGEGAEAEINGATVLAGKSQAHNFVRIRHLVPHCASRQHFKSVASDVSRSSVDGTIFVARDAQGTNAYQLINNLMLSDEARTDSKPQLMIHADDVKCSHGATTGKLDPAQQFYLESRGFDPAQARALLTVAFIAEILEKAGDAVPGFRSGLDHALLDTLKKDPLKKNVPGASPAQPGDRHAYG